MRKFIALLFLTVAFLSIPFARAATLPKPILTAVSPSSVRVDWDPSTALSGNSFYQVLRNGDNAGTTRGTTFTDDGLASGTYYAYSVQVVDGSGQKSDPSPYAIIKTPPGIPGDLVPPSVPIWQTAVATSPTSVQVSWLPSSDNVTVASYRVYRNNVLATTTQSTAFTDTDLTPSTVYTYRITAVDISGNVSDYSASKNATTLDSVLGQDTLPPTQPANVSAVAVSPGQINLSWSASTDNIGVTSYKIYRDKNYLANVTSANYSDFSVLPSQTYSYVVEAFDGAGNQSIDSVPATATTPGQGGGFAPNPPTRVIASYADHQVRLEWINQSNNETHFTIERRKVGANTWDKVTDSVGAHVTHFEDSNIPASTYEYRIAACADLCSSSSPSNQIAVGSNAIQTAFPSQASSDATVKKINAPVGFSFTRNLKSGMTGSEINLLQHILILENLLPSDSATGLYGRGTESAVTKFQEKYSSEILVPANLKQGNGIVGELTRKKLNQLLGIYIGANQAATVSGVSSSTVVSSSTLPLPTPMPVSTSLNPTGTASSVVTSFTHTLQKGMKIPEVKALQNILVKEGLMDPIAPNGYFGEGTFKAVTAFQEKYRSEILTPAGLSSGNGIVGELTRKKLNQLLSLILLSSSR